MFVKDPVFKLCRTTVVFLQSVNFKESAGIDFEIIKRVHIIHLISKLSIKKC